MYFLTKISLWLDNVQNQPYLTLENVQKYCKSWLDNVQNNYIFTLEIDHIENSICIID